MLIRPNPSSGVPIYLQLMEQVKHAIETGALRPGEQLPGIRPLAEELVINPNTVAKAYRELEHEGLVELRHGAGAFVSAQARVKKQTDKVRAGQAAVADAVARLRKSGLTGEEIRRLFEAELAGVNKTGPRTRSARSTRSPITWRSSIAAAPWWPARSTTSASSTGASNWCSTATPRTPPSRHGVCLFVAGTALFSLTFLLSTVFNDIWRPPLIVACGAACVSFAEQLVRGLSRYSLFGVMSAESYFRDGTLPWVGLAVTASASAAMLYLATVNMSRHDF